MVVDRTRQSACTCSHSKELFAVPPEKASTKNKRIARLRRHITERRILIGPVTLDSTESVGAVNEAIIEGLKDRFSFVPHIATRSIGANRQGSFSVLNLLFALKHVLIWVWCLIRSSPAIAHYAVTSDWNLEKSLLMLRLARLFGAKTVGHLHGGLFLERWKALPQWRKRRALRELRRLDSFVVLSEGWRAAVRTQIGIEDSRIFVVNNPISANFEQSALQMAIRRETRNVLCFGVMDRKKGVLDILRAVELLGPKIAVNFQLVGPEREAGILQEVVSAVRLGRLSPQVTIIGPAFGDDKIRLFREAAAFLLPSYAENFPLSVLEAAAAGLPVIATPVGATPEFFDDGVSAILVPPGSPERIAAAVLRLLDSADTRAELGATARRMFLERLRREKIMESLVDIYDALLSTASPQLN
jgi:glycosyltransferase involved in cell wall biosynthesis